MLRSSMIAVVAVGLVGALALAQADVGGSWTLTISDPLGMNNEVPLTLEQDGATLTGQAGESPLEGTVDGDRITMSYEVDSAQVGLLRLAFSGRIDGSNMSGSVAFGRYASGSWTAVKAE